MIRNTFSALLITVVTLAHQTLYAGQEHPFPVATPESQGLSSQAVQQLTEAVASYVEDDRVVGAELLVIKNHKTVLHETFGWRDRDDEIPMRMNTIFNIRSMTKPVTGTAAQMLIDEGKLSADDPVAKYLPSFDDDKSRPITVGHLLTHRSGLSRTVPANEPTLRAIADCCGARGPEEFLPGTSYRYSNGGSSTVGAVVEEIAGAPLDEFMARRIFRPLGMNDTLGLHHGADPRLSRAASRYEDRGGKWVRTWKTGAVPVPGGLSRSG